MMKCLILLLTTTASVHARGFQWYCSLTSGPVYKVVKDLSTGALSFINGTRDDSVLEGSTGGRRRLSSTPLDLSLFDAFDEETFSQDALHVKRRTANEIIDGSEDMSDIILMRECRCVGSKEAYCPAYLSACGIPSMARENQAPVCVDVNNKRRSFVRTMFVAVVVAYAIIILCMFTTWGKNVMGFFADTLFPGWNLFSANRMMRRDPERANEWIRRYLVIRRRMLQRRYRVVMGPESSAHEYAARAAAVAAEQRFIAGVNSPSNPISLALKTRIHRVVIPDEFEISPPGWEDDEESIDEETCTICFVSLQEGDRVGDLACFHTFHAECLKSWLLRRNVCPLCQQPNAATPQFGDTQVINPGLAGRDVI